MHNGPNWTGLSTLVAVMIICPQRKEGGKGVVWTTKGPFIATQLNSTSGWVELHWRSVYSDADATQLNSTSSCRHVRSVNNCHLSMNAVTQLTQFVGHDVINKNTTDLLRAWLAVHCSTGSVELSCVAIDTLTEHAYSDTTRRRVECQVELSCVGKVSVATQLNSTLSWVVSL